MAYAACSTSASGGTVDGTASSTAGTHVVQRAIFRPRGLAGRLYWWVLIPFHAIIFPGMLRNALKHAEKQAVA